MASSWLSNWISKLTSSWLKWAQQQAIAGTRCDPCSAGCSLTLVMKPCPQTLWGRGRPQDMSMPGQYTAWKRRMSLPMMWFPGHPYCFRFSAVGSIPSGNRPERRDYCSCFTADRMQAGRQDLLIWLPGQSCCLRLSTVGSLLSGNRPEQQYWFQHT